MYVAHLALANFRNYAALEQELPAGLILLEGENAQGKSNLLEALFFLATSRSPRTNRDGELLSWRIESAESVATRLFARVVRAAEEVTLEILLMASAKGEGRSAQVARAEEELLASAASGLQKRIRVNGVTRRAIDFLGTFRVVLFRPEDLELVSGPPAGRRRALDILLSQIETRYPRALQRYGRVLQQRNHLLRRIAEGRAAPEELEPWDESLVKEGAYVLAQRFTALDALTGMAAQYHEPLSGGRERLTAAYISTIAPRADIASDGDALAAAFRGQLIAVRTRDIALGQTTVGPHRDDLSLLVDGAAASTYGSRGQQRTVALAWKLAEARYLRETTGEDPVVLLDDVLSELDASRRRCVLEAVKDYQQVFLTSTGAELVGETLHTDAGFLVRSGQLTPLGA